MSEKIYENIEHNGMYYMGKLISYTQPLINKYWGNYFEISEIIENLYISDFSSACDKEKLKNFGITHIVTVIAGVDKMFPDDFEYYIVNICDRNYVDIKNYFDECSGFINDALKKNGKVLVHCKCGISRSATIVGAFLISKKAFTCQKAINLMKEKRNCVNPNDGFLKQLNEYEIKIKK
jgi:protein-tyrosine phosphatase